MIIGGGIEASTPDTVAVEKIPSQRVSTEVLGHVALEGANQQTNSYEVPPRDPNHPNWEQDNLLLG